MAVMKWGTPPKGNAEDRRAHIVGHGEGVALQHAVSGDKVQGGAQISSLNPNYALANRWLSTAPYRGDEEVEFGLKAPTNPHGYRDASRQNKCMALDDTCGSYATVASERKWCVKHVKQMET